MKSKTLTFASAVVLGLALSIGFTIASAEAQSGTLEAQKKELARATDIVRQLRAGKPLTPEEVNVLENLLGQLEKAIGREEAARGASTSIATPAPSEKRGSKPQSPVALGLSRQNTKDGPVFIYTIDLDSSDLRSFWLDRRNKPYGSILRLADDQYREGYRLKFAINGGIFDQELRPQGLYVEQGKVLAPLDTTKTGVNVGNFYLDPNGVFLVDARGNARILTTHRFMEQFPSRTVESLRIAVQSGPALVVDGTINTLFAEESANKKKRSGVGVIGERRVVFGMSPGDISFYEFAALFARLGCRDALYLDGGEVGALFSSDNSLSLRTSSALVTMFAVIEKLPVR